MKALSSVGLEAVIVGHEFLDNAQLSQVNKRSNVTINTQSVRILLEAGIDTLASFIIPPDCEPDYFPMLLDYIHDNHISNIVLQTFTPLPGTKLYDEWKGRLLTHDRELFDMSHVIVPYSVNGRNVLKGIRSVYAGTFLKIHNLMHSPGTMSLGMGIDHKFRLLAGGISYFFALKRAGRHI